MPKCDLVKQYTVNTGDGVLLYLYLLTRLNSVVLLLLHYLNIQSALQHVDAGVAQIFTYKVF